MLTYIKNEVPDNAKIIKIKGEPVFFNEETKKKRMGYAQVHLNDAEQPTYVQTRLPNWVK